MMNVLKVKQALPLWLKCFCVMTLLSHTPMFAQQHITEVLEKVQEMLLSTDNYSTNLVVQAFNENHELQTSEEFRLYKSASQFYRSAPTNETLVTDEIYLYLDHETKRMLLMPSKVKDFSIAMMGFDGSWMSRKDLELVTNRPGLLGIRVPKVGTYEEVIYYFDAENYLFHQIKYVQRKNANSAVSYTIVSFEDTKSGDAVASKAPKTVKDFLSKRRSHWHSLLTDYTFVNRINE